MKNTLKIATRKSPLAMWQAQYVQQKLQVLYPQLDIQLVTMTTKGDVLLDTPLAKIGGKGLFVKELENALLNGQADIAVHSIKDIPISFPQGLELSTICERGDPFDAFVSNHYHHIDELPDGAIVGTSSLRRQSQIRAHYPHLIIKDLRGNVGSRLSKLDQGHYDAIILACAGLKRLNIAHRITSTLAPTLCLPAVGQGAIGIECRSKDLDTKKLLAPLNHLETSIRVSAERAMNNYLNGGCQVPIGSYATLDKNQLTLTALVAEPDGSIIIKKNITGCAENAVQMGENLAQQLLDNGANKILKKLFH